MQSAIFPGGARNETARRISRHPAPPLLPLAMAIAMLLAGCNAGKEMAQSMGDLLVVQKAVVKAANTSGVSVNLTNGRYLSIVLTNSPINRMGPEERKAKAFGIAKLAYRALSSRDRIERVNVALVEQRSLLVLHFRNVAGNYSYDVAGLGDAQRAE